MDIEIPSPLFTIIEKQNSKKILLIKLIEFFKKINDKNLIIIKLDIENGNDLFDYKVELEFRIYSQEKEIRLFSTLEFLMDFNRKIRVKILNKIHKKNYSLKPIIMDFSEIKIDNIGQLFKERKILNEDNFFNLDEIIEVSPKEFIQILNPDYTNLYDIWEIFFWITK